MSILNGTIVIRGDGNLKMLHWCWQNCIDSLQELKTVLNLRVFLGVIPVGMKSYLAHFMEDESFLKRFLYQGFLWSRITEQSLSF